MAETETEKQKMRLDSALKKSRPRYISAQKSRHFLMHWMSVKFFFFFRVQSVLIIERYTPA